MMNSIIIVNGKAYMYHLQTILELLIANGFPPYGVAVMVNARIIPRNRWQTTYVQPNDQVKIVRAFEEQAGGCQ